MDLLTRSWDLCGFNEPTREWLDRQYHQSHRHYHGIGHIWDLLHKIELIPGNWCPAEWKAPLHRVAWFHDSRYYGQAGKDEEVSADEMRIWLGYDEDHPEVLAVLDTAGHEAPSSPMAALFLDLDLSRLGTHDYDQFILDSEMIRAEYRHVPEEAWLRGRRDFLAKMAARPTIYHSPWGHASWERQTKLNLERAVKYYDLRIEAL